MTKGRFVNLNIQNNIEDITEGFKNTYSNPYYPFIDKGKTVVTYFSQSNELSTLDEGNLKAYSDRGKLSPIKFNRIEKVVIYGIEKIMISLQNGDFGVEADDITGEGTMLPGLDPKPNDYFIIDHYKNKFLFKITDVSIGTPEVEDIYQIRYRYIKNDSDNILDNVVGNYTMIVSNVGTNYKAVIENHDLQFIKSLEDIMYKLKDYYCSLFFNDRVETFIVEELFQLVYDPVLIEFIIRNKLFNHNGLYIYTQQMHLEKTFIIEYDKTLFKCIEDKDIKSVENVMNNAYLEKINQPMSILSMRQEKYFRAKYVSDTSNIPKYETIMNIFDSDFVEGIINNNILDIPDRLENIVINYMNDKTITKEDVSILNEIDFKPTKRLFYMLPIVIFIIQNNINKLIKINKGGL